MTTKIEKGTAKKGKPGKPLKYPFDKLELKDSFFWDNIKIDSLSPCARSYGKKHKKIFSCSTEGNGVRVSRIK